MYYGTIGLFNFPKSENYHGHHFWLWKNVNNARLDGYKPYNAIEELWVSIWWGSRLKWYSKSIWWESTYVMAMFRCLALPCWALDDSCLPLELIVRIDFTLFVLSTKKFLFSGSIVCGNKDGIYQEIFLLCTIKWWLCAGSSALDRIWTSLHSLLAPYSSLGVGILTTGVCNWCMATSI